MTLRGLDISALPETERKILTIVCTRLVCAISDKHVYEAVTAKFTCNGDSFTAKGKTVITDGWKQWIVDSGKLKVKDEESDLPEEELSTINSQLSTIIEGQTFENVTADVSEHFTAPPKPHTDATLLSSMETAGAADTTDDAERKGLGTPATRAAIIETLVTRGFVIRKGKQLIPTPDGEKLISILPDTLKSPALTAEWENALTLIAKGDADAENFMRGIEDMARSLVTEACRKQ